MIIVNPYAQSLNLLAQYNFDGNIVDLTGNTTASVVNTTYDTDRFGNSGKSLRFPGTLSRFILTNPLILPTNYSVSLYLYTYSSSGVQVILSNKNLYIQGVQLYINGTTLYYGYDSIPGAITGAITANSWYHIVITHSSTGRKLYINKSLKGSSTNVGQNNILSLIGEYYQGYGTWYLNGKVDDFKVFNKELSQEEINSL